jgi:hypothetical protein
MRIKSYLSIRKRGLPIMHKYLKAIGFGNYTRHKEIQQLLDTVYEDADTVDAVSVGTDVFVSMTKEFGDGFGLQIFGEYDECDRFQIEYYFPYVSSTSPACELSSNVQRHADKSAYSAMCEEYNLGISLIYYIQNTTDYIRFLQKYKKTYGVFPIKLSALSTNGKVLLPILKSERQQANLKVLAKQRAKLVESARNGDENAIENLTMEDMDLFNSAVRRIQSEDLYSIVDTSFMPSGVECDHYSIVGEILDCKEVDNSITKEKLYSLHVESNNIAFQILIHQEDLLGVPAIGRRFKGEIWLQGQIDFPE